jgi:hypothetical protein
MTGELLQIGQDWKPCKVVVKMHLEIYVEDEEPQSLSQADLERSPLDDIRQSFNNLS